MENLCNWLKSNQLKQKRVSPSLWLSEKKKHFKRVFWGEFFQTGFFQV